MLSYSRPIGDVIHVHAETQYELNRAFIRPQEYYESGFPELQGNLKSTVESIAKVYREKGVEFDYFSKWNGFNMPGHVYAHWLAQHRPCGLSQIEARLMAVVVDAQEDGINPRHYYLIGTHREEEIRHELAHAMFYLDANYRTQCMRLIDSFKERNYDVYANLVTFLKERGYAESVIDDEVQAYLGEAELGYWTKKFGVGMGGMTWVEGQPFASLCTINLEKHGYATPAP